MVKLKVNSYDSHLKAMSQSNNLLKRDTC